MIVGALGELEIATHSIPPCCCIDATGCPAVAFAASTSTSRSARRSSGDGASVGVSTAPPARRTATIDSCSALGTAPPSVGRLGNRSASQHDSTYCIVSKEVCGGGSQSVVWNLDRAALFNRPARK